MSPRSESDLSRLRRLAQLIATERGDELTTIHLLAAVHRLGGPGRELLAARRLDEATLMSGARAYDEAPDLLESALGQARDLARRAAVPARAPGLPDAPSGVHVLVALVSNRRHAAYRSLTQSGVDVARLRTAATQIALGLVQPPRSSREETPTAQPAAQRAPRAQQARTASRPPSPSETKPAPEPPRRPRMTGPRRRAVQVPLIPPLRRKHDATQRRARPAADVERTTSDVPPKSDVAPKSEPAPKAGCASDVAPKSDAAPRKRKPKSAKAASPTPKSRRKSKTAPPVDAPSELPAVLTELTRDLTALAAEGMLEPVVAREREIERCLDILAKRHANCALLVGPSGVGKTSLARGLALRLAGTSRRLLELRTSELVAGTAARGSLAERVSLLRRAVVEHDVVLFVDEIHDLLDNDELLTELKDALAQGELPMVATTSPARFAQDIEVDPALARRFTVVEVDEPSVTDAFLMLRKVADGLGDHHAVSMPDEAVALAISWSVRYLPGRALPDKAVGLLDLAGARLARRHDGDDEPEVTPEQVAEVVAEQADVPIERLLESDHDRMLALHRTLAKRVVGHERACERIAAVLRRNAAGLRGPRPIGTFLLLGPTGVGKTETAKALAEALFHAPEAMTRLDMSEYAEPHAIARLLGAPPGYVGHEAGGLLTESVRRRPYQVILLDEIEKAHRDVLQAFLQVFDEGRLTDGRGRTVDFRHTVLVLTSNLGAAEMTTAMNKRPVGFGRTDGAARVQSEGLQEVAVKAARSSLPPELYNRLDEVIFFRPLSRDDVRMVAKRLLAGLGRQLAARGIKLEVESEALDALLDQGGFDPELGARPVRRAIARLVEVPLADLLLRGQLAEGDVALVGAHDGKVVVDAVASAA